MQSLKRYLNLLATGAACLMPFLLSAQDFDNIVKGYQTMRTPQTADLGSAVFSEVSMFTGKPSINLPVYTLKNHDLEVPISISFDAGGFIPVKAPTMVGLNWSLIAGGVITRNVNNIPDEYDNATGTQGTSYGFFHRGDSTFSNAQVLNVASHMSGGFYKHLFELAPDLFVFNFGNHSGQFMMGQDGEFHVQGDRNYKILPELGSTSAGVFGPASYTGKITMIDDEGIEYTFGGSDASIEYSSSGNEFSNAVPNAWYLVKIKSPEGHEVLFNYAETSGTYALKGVNSNYTKLSYYNAADHTVDQTVKNVYLRSIITKTRDGDVLQTVDFHNSKQGISFSSTYLNEQLDSITVKDYAGTTRKSYGFTYSQVTHGDSGVRTLLSSFGEKGLPFYTFSYYNQSGLNVSLSSSVDYWGYYNANYSGTANTANPEYDDQLNMTTVYPQFAANLADARTGMLYSITNPSGGITEYDYELNNYSTTYRHDLANDYLITSSNLLADFTGGGLRVSEIRLKEGNTTVQTRKFKYVKNYTPTTSGLSSGVMTRRPQRYRFDFVTAPSLSSVGEAPLYYSEVVEVFDDGGYRINKFTADEFPDRTYPASASPAQYYTVVANPVDLQYDLNLVVNFFKKRTSTALERGKPSLVTSYTSTGRKVASTSYTYNTDPNRYTNNKIASIDYPVIGNVKFFIGSGLNGMLNTSETYYFNTKLTRQDETLYDSTGTAAMLTTTKFNYNNNRQLSKKSMVKSNGVEEVEKYRYVGDYAFSGGTDPLKQMQDLYITAPLIESQKLIRVNDTTKLLGATMVNYAKWNSLNIFRPSQVRKLHLLAPAVDTTFSSVVSNVFTPRSDYSSINPEIVFNAYTNDGRVRQFQPKGLTPAVTYVWSYGGQYPVAEIRNGTYAQAQTAVGSTTLDNLEKGSSPDVVTLSVTLRSNLPGAMINTYGYDVFSGINLVIDPRGKSTTYDHDALERLQAVKDQNGDIVKAYEYHYKGQ